MTRQTTHDVKHRENEGEIRDIRRENETKRKVQRAGSSLLGIEYGNGTWTWTETKIISLLFLVCTYDIPPHLDFIFWKEIFTAIGKLGKKRGRKKIVKKKKSNYEDDSPPRDWSVCMIHMESLLW